MLAFLMVLVTWATLAQGPITGAPVPGAPPAQAGGRGGRGGPALPGATAEQTQAVTSMNAALAEPTAAVTAARMELAQATFASTKNVASITAALDKVRAAELTLALKRADEFGKLQNGPNKLSAEQVAALVAASSNTGGPGRGGPPPPGGRGN